MKKVYNKITILIILLIYLPQISVFDDLNNSTEIKLEEEDSVFANSDNSSEHKHETEDVVFANSDNLSDSESESELEEGDFTYMISGGRRNRKQLGYVKCMVSIRTHRPTKYFGDNHFCAGTIIGRKKILTAAHCVMDKRKVPTRPRHLLIVAGTPNRLRIDNTTRQMGVEKVIPHLNYIRYNTDDIALVILQEEMIFNPAIRIMKLPTSPPPYEINCTIIGWGRMYYKGPLSAGAVWAKVLLLTPEECRRMTNPNHFMLCAVDRVLYNEDPCGGDMGGPLICAGVQTGVVSWTVGCGSKTLPSLYTDVYKHLDWIRESRARHLPNCALPSIMFLLITSIFILS